MRHVILVSLILSVLTLAPNGFADSGGQHISGTLMKISGVVSKMQSGVTIIKTQRGLMTMSPGGLKDFKVGDEVDVWVNESNRVIDVRRAGGNMNGRERPSTKSHNGPGADTAVTKIEPGLIF